MFEKKIVATKLEVRPLWPCPLKKNFFCGFPYLYAQVAEQNLVYPVAACYLHQRVAQNTMRTCSEKFDLICVGHLFISAEVSNLKFPAHRGNVSGATTVCPRSNDPIYIVGYYIKGVTTSWAHCI